MSLLPIHHYSLFDDPFFPEPWGFFDPWFDFHLTPMPLSPFPRLSWIDRPTRMSYRSRSRTRTTATTSKGANVTSQATNGGKFRVEVDVTGFHPDNIKTRVDGRQIFVEARHEDRQNERNYSLREIRKVYDLPDHVDGQQVTSFVGPNNTLVVEAPYRSFEADRQLVSKSNDQQSLTPYGENRDRLLDDSGLFGGSDFQRRIIDKGNNEKQLEMTLLVKGYKPDEIKVSVRNDVLIVEGQRAHQDGSRSEKSYFSKTVTLPPGTQVDQLESKLNDDGVLKIEAPFLA